MLTLEELETRQQKELAEYAAERSKRLDALQKDQEDLLNGITSTNPNAHAMLEKMLHEQQQNREAAEQDEFDLLRHFHSLERERFLEKQAIREELAGGIRARKDNSPDHNR